MSDGNFNRSLYPSTPYASGLKAGRAQGRQWATEAFAQWLRMTWPEMDGVTARQHQDAFVAKLQEIMK